MMKHVLVAAGLALCAFAPAVFAQDKPANPWQVRVRAIGILPDEAISTRPNVNAAIDISDQVVPELDISYFFTKNVSAELILGTAKHDVKLTRTAVGPIDLGSVFHLPPTLTLQYHFNADGKFRPYVGAGVNYTLFYNDDLPSGGPVTGIDYDATFGWAAQVGFDYFYTDNWGVNVDVKKIDISPEVNLATALGPISADVDIDPWVIGVGVTYKY
jgi:outer membrane protein